jgi:hypothetical protein
MNKVKMIISSVYATILTVTFVVGITIWAELSAPLKDWLKDFSGHHWVSKSILSVLIYIIATALFYKLVHDESSGSFLQRWLSRLLLAVILGTFILTAFYTGHHLNFW